MTNKVPVCCYSILLSWLTLFSTGIVVAEPVYLPSGPQLTFGGMTQRRMTVSDTGNPAIDTSLDQKSSRYVIGASIGLGIEYDGNDNLFKLLNRAGSDGALVSPGGGTGGGSSGGQGGITIDITNPKLQALIDGVKTKANSLGIFLATVVTGVNAKAYTSADIPVLISNNTLGGAWTFEANYSVTTNLRGLLDPIEFDSTKALAQLQTAFNKNMPITKPQTYDLTGGASVTVNPDGTTKFRFENNSGTITRAAQVTEFALGYSRKVWQKEDNRVYIGIKPKFYSVGLSNTAIPIANIKNAKSIFNALDKSNFKYEQGFGVDLGAIYTGKQYQLGATLTNINEPTFQYPAADLSGFTSAKIINEIRSRETYTMQRQLKLEGGVISSTGAWGLNVGLDANAVPDPMGDDYQWLSIGTGFASDNWWLPGVRLGVRKNLAGTALTYITAGVTVFNVVNLDIASTTNTVVINNQTVPRSAIINLSAQFAF